MLLWKQVTDGVLCWFNCTSSMLMNVQLRRWADRCRRMCHTCTSMTWTHFITSTWGQMDLLKKNTRFACSAFFFNSLHFLRWSCSSWASEQLSDKKGNVLYVVGFSSTSNWTKLDLRFTDEEWKAWVSLMLTESRPCRLRDVQIRSITSDASQTVRGGIEA